MVLAICGFHSCYEWVLCNDYTHTGIHGDLQTCWDTHSDRIFSCTVPSLLSDTDDVHSVSLPLSLMCLCLPPPHAHASTLCTADHQLYRHGLQDARMCLLYEIKQTAHSTQHVWLPLSPLSPTLSPPSVSKSFLVLPSFVIFSSFLFTGP